MVRTDLNPLMAVQAAFVVPVFLACAWMLFHQPISRRTRGSGMLASVCVTIAVLWLVYAAGFLFVRETTPGSVAAFLRAVVFHNSYIDVLLELVLGFGMILAVLDDLFLEAEEARATRLLDVAAVVGFALLVNLIACLGPAWRAARLQPSTALRYE
jgi:ABC-type antimicrobial peptide transport system permease subunit